ncbi:hypothetical protein EV191_102329 [Tamaricihabitans halophyticus]|uniref:Uncharacterized protein n=1 Tax=Tamaricihabitans halophyticus TaxID=1262583 RepID=A0A4R2QZJ5_9PSEU|nr:hypothetical protein [Tamaricihabitans halophyticus]TCP55117.1 hypothetical protein EV191_102329 [Tamaricihabitans halophyticus]
MTGHEDQPQLAEELALLLEMVLSRAQPWLDGVIAAGHSGERAHADSDQDSDARQETSECTWCPLCAVVAMARGQRPELVATVLEHAAEVIALLRAVLADRWDPSTVHMPGFRPEREAPSGDSPPDQGQGSSAEHARRCDDVPRGPRSPRVQHIAVQRKGAPAGGSA